MDVLNSDLSGILDVSLNSKTVDLRSAKKIKIRRKNNAAE